MGKIKLSLGYDTERPHGLLARGVIGRHFRKRQLSFVQKLIRVLDEKSAPRTFFILGDYLERCLDDFSAEELRVIYNPANPLNDLQQHSYSHKSIRPFGGIEGVVLNRSIMDPAEFADDLERANKVIFDILGVVPSGLRTPYGYERDLADMPEVLKHLKILGFNFVSSNLRSKKFLKAELTPKRQPHAYADVGFPDIVEIPTHGWQDVIFTANKAMLFLHRKPDKPEKIFQHYSGLFRKALALRQCKQPIYINLCLHPWAAMEYDPDLEIHKRLIDAALELGIEIISYKQVALEVAR